MRLKRYYVLMGLIGIMLVGCQGQEIEDDPQATAELPDEPVARQDTFNRAAVEGFPLQVRTAFTRDYPDSAITQAEIQPAETGPLLYRIVFIRDGQPHSVTYDRAGQIVTPAAILSAEPGPPNLR